MTLSRKEILKHLDKEIVTDLFDEAKMNPNSYNLSLHSELLVCDTPVLDMKTPDATTLIQIPPEGLTLASGRLYLGRTKKFTKTEGFVPMLEGHSSTGRLGMCAHATAGFDDVGSAGFWMLEIFVAQSLITYPGVEACQIYYHTIIRGYDPYCSGKYQNNKGAQSSLLYKDSEKNQEWPSVCNLLKKEGPETGPSSLQTKRCLGLKLRRRFQ